MDIIWKDHIKEVKAELGKAKQKALVQCGMQAETYAKENLKMNGSVDTGVLRNSVAYAATTSPARTMRLTNEMAKAGRSAVAESVRNSDESTVFIGTNICYGAYVELGTGIYYPTGRKTPWVYKDRKGKFHTTHGMPAKPFLKPAIADHKSTYKKIIENTLKNG